MFSHINSEKQYEIFIVVRRTESETKELFVFISTLDSISKFDVEVLIQKKVIMYLIQRFNYLSQD